MENDTNNTPKTTRCLNCGTEFEGKYCPECSQSAKTGRFTPRFLIDNLLLAILGQDASIWFSIKSLFIRPGEMMVEILNGKRKKYLSPFPMLFMVLTFYILLTALFNVSIVDILVHNSTELPVGATPEEISHYKTTHFFEDALRFYFGHYTLCSVLTIPLAVIAARVFYGKKNRKRYNWAEYTIVIVYSMVILTLFRCFTKLLFPIQPVLTTAFGIVFSPVVAIIANTACFRKVLGFSVVNTAWRSFLMEVFYYLLMSILIGLITIIFALVVAIKY